LNARTDTQLILYSVQWYALHWTENNFIARFLADRYVKH